MNATILQFASLLAPVMENAFWPALLTLFVVAVALRAAYGFTGKPGFFANKPGFWGTIPGLLVAFGIFGTFVAVAGAFSAMGDVSTGKGLEAFMGNMMGALSASVGGFLASVVFQFLDGLMGKEKVAPQASVSNTTSISFEKPVKAPRFVKRSKPLPTPLPVPSVETIPDFAMAPAEELPVVTNLENIEMPPIPEIETSPAEDDRLAILRHRLETLNTYIEKADQDKASGVMPVEMWEEEHAAYLEEKNRLETELSELESRPQAA